MYFLRHYVYLPIRCVYTETLALPLLRHLYMFLLSYLAYMFAKTLYAYSLRHCVCTELSVHVFTDTLHLLRYLYMYEYLRSYLAYVFTKTLYAYSLIHCVFTGTLCACIY